jgi:molybdate transport system ATP-binding protein
VVAGLAATVGIRRGDFRLDLELEVADGEVVALLGPNGAGKSTALRALAGLIRIDDGRIVLGGLTLADAASREHLPTHRRPISVVFQDYLLFPHLSVLDNVAFGLRARGRPATTARQVAGSWLERIGVGELASARPRAISGGQAQRVAIARALAVDPQLLLLDEPLAALDARTRLLVRGELRRHLADFGGATLVVTHDPIDAAVLADRLVVIERGQVVQQGPPREVARHPRTDYVARLVGLNLLAGVADGHRVVLPTGGVVHLAESAVGAVNAAFRPAAVSLFINRPDGSPRNVWYGRILVIEPHGEGVRIDIGGAPDAASSILAEVTPGAVADLGLQPGSMIWASVKASDVEAYPADPGPAGSSLPVA